MATASMTGFGRASVTKLGLVVTVEIRSTNHRYLKVVTKVPPHAQARAPEIESIIRSELTRGAVDVHLRIQHKVVAQAIRVDEDTAVAYYSFAKRIEKKMKSAAAIKATDLLTLPGVIGGLTNEELTDPEWAVCTQSIRTALKHHVAARRAEGRRLVVEIKNHMKEIVRLIAEIKKRSRQTVGVHRTRLKQRIDRALAKSEAVVNEADLLREVAIYTDRSDISEEIERLGSHFAQFSAVLKKNAEIGRELDFMVQEMFREVNTIGSKAGDAEISHQIVAVKVEIEKIREQVQNLQ